ncbi:MAG: TspO/MBR family protein [Pseudomonadota bacterium]
MSWTVLGAFLALNFAAASAGALFKPGAWYERLAKPGWTPPDWAFPLVWSVLFILNALAGALVWQASVPGSAMAIGVYGVSLAINFAWSALFFGIKRMDLALIDVIGLWVSIAVTMALFWPISPLASLFQAPYLLWVTIAAALNLRVMQMNRREISA